MNVYVTGSLRNENIPRISERLRQAGHIVFDDWFAAGPIADDSWKKYEQERGHSYLQALEGHAARHVFEFDRTHLTLADTVVLVLPAGKSAHLELGWAIGKGKRGYVLLDSPDRWDVMYQFADGVFTDPNRLVQELAYMDHIRKVETV